MERFKLVFYADSVNYKNKRFVFSMPSVTWFTNGSNLLDKFNEKGNVIRSAMFVKESINSSGQVIKSELIHVPLPNYLKSLP